MTDLLHPASRGRVVAHRRIPWRGRRTIRACSLLEEMKTPSAQISSRIARRGCHPAPSRMSLRAKRADPPRGAGEEASAYFGLPVLVEST